MVGPGAPSADRLTRPVRHARGPRFECAMAETPVVLHVPAGDTELQVQLTNQQVLNMLAQLSRIVAVKSLYLADPPL